MQLDIYVMFTLNVLSIAVFCITLDCPSLNPTDRVKDVMCVYNRKLFSVSALSSISVNIPVEFTHVDHGNASYCFKCMVSIVSIV